VCHPFSRTKNRPARAGAWPVQRRRPARPKRCRFRRRQRLDVDRQKESIHAAICGELSDEPFELPKDKPQTMAAYQVEPIKTACVEAIAVGGPLPDMPLYLYGECGIEVPLEET
jgi:hypothetical protein